MRLADTCECLKKYLMADATMLTCFRSARPALSSATFCTIWILFYFRIPIRRAVTHVVGIHDKKIRVPGRSLLDLETVLIS
jgi:hypothetical protein